MESPFITITIHTYQRVDGKTPELLRRALNSIVSQTYKNYQLIIVGDKYENEKELFDLVSEYGDDIKKITCVNLDYAKERDLYLNVNNEALWNSGGANALNYANKLAIQMNTPKVAHLDHDDYWLPNHLENIARAIVEKDNPAFVYTLSKYLHHPVFPIMPTDGQIVESYPQYCALIHSSIYMDLEQLPLDYRDMWEVEKIHFPSDGDMWNRVRDKCIAENLKSYVIHEVTCVHDNENY